MLVSTASDHDDDPVPAWEPPELHVSSEMRIHLGDRGSAVMRFSESAHALGLDLLLVPADSRSRGLGSLLLLRLCALADALDKTAFATLRPFGTAAPQALARLVAFFRRFGFVVVDERPGAVEVERPAGGRHPAP